MFASVFVLLIGSIGSLIFLNFINVINIEAILTEFKALDAEIRYIIAAIPAIALVAAALIDIVKTITEASLKRLRTKADLALKLKNRP